MNTFFAIQRSTLSFVPSFSTLSPVRLLSALVALLVMLLPQQLQTLDTAMQLPSMPSTLSHSSLADMPLSFFPNLGQAPAAVQMQANGLGGTLTFAATHVALTLPTNEMDAPTSLLLLWQGANPQASIHGVDQLPGLLHSYVGAPTAWRSNVPTFAALSYQNLYRGINLRYEGQQGMLKGTYFVSPDANPALIRWRYQGAQSVTLDSVTGDLLIQLSDGSVLREDAPIAWQDGPNGRIPVAARFVVEGESVRFALAAYDSQVPLIIDPTFRYSTYLGGNNTDYGKAIAVAADGSVVVTGQTYSTNFPGASGPVKGNTNLYVSKLNPEGNALIYTTILGGSADEESFGVALDSLGNAWVTGETRSSNFPADVLSSTYEGNSDAFIAKLDAKGVLLHSGYLGVPAHDVGYAVAIDKQDNAYVAGEAGATYGPESFVKKIKADMSAIVYEAFFGFAKRGFDKGTSVRAIAVDGAGNAYVSGRTNAVLSEVDDGGYQPFCVEFDGVDCTFDDAVVIKLAADGKSIPHYSYLGGKGNDIATGIALDIDGNVWVTGYTFAANFPVKNALQSQKQGLDNFTDAFVTKLNPQLNDLLYSTYLGGEYWEEAHGLTVDRHGAIYIVGMTNSPDDFPISSDAPQPKLGNGICNVGSTERYCYDGFATKLTANGTLEWSTFVGGSNDDLANGIAVDGDGNAYVVGDTESTSFPTTSNAFQKTKALDDDAFLVKITLAPLPSSDTHIFLPLVQR